MCLFHEFSLHYLQFLFFSVTLSQINEDRLRLGIKNEQDSFCASLGLHYLCHTLFCKESNNVSAKNKNISIIVVPYKLIIMKRVLCILCLLAVSHFVFSGNYKSFKVAVYVRAYEVEKMNDKHWLDSTWNIISSQVKIDKIYLETHRDLLIVPSETLEEAKKFFLDKGIEVGGGITYTVNESNNFETFSYSNPEHRKKVQEIAVHTAKHFDDYILDDFFFTSSKSDYEIKAKGTKSWTQYRMDLLAEAGKSLIIDPSRKVNPKVKIIIKYPNWYDHFQGLGLDRKSVV